MALFLDTRSQKLQHLQKRLFGRLVTFQVAYDPQTECAFQKVWYTYDFNTKLYRKQPKVLQNDKMDKICNTEWGKTRNIKSLNLAAVKHMTNWLTHHYSRRRGITQCKRLGLTEVLYTLVTVCSRKHWAYQHQTRIYIYKQTTTKMCM